VIGSGPAGQKAAIQGAKAGKRVALVERDKQVGGACVHHGTIPSKTLRESALNMVRFQRTSNVFDFRLRDDLTVPALIQRLDEVVQAHSVFMAAQLDRNQVTRIHARAKFISEHDIECTTPKRTTDRYSADVIVIATGSRPRRPDNVPVDHEHILDSDSILSMTYLPKTLMVLGGGVIASEYASFFSILGVQVVMVDQADRPLRFMDAEITNGFVQAFQASGGRYYGQQKIEEVKWDGLSKVMTRLGNGETLESEKMLMALGRVANIADLNLQAIGIEPTPRGVIPVDEFYRTTLPHVYAVGDVIGPPSLASFSMEQGRRAVCHALAIDPGHPAEMVPMGIFTVPEMSSVGINEEEAVLRHGGALVGRARFQEIARGQISGMTDGLLKLVADPQGKKLLGIHIVGEGACELVHIGQMGLLAKVEIDSFVENIFNFPTMAETYRVAALDIVKQRPR
jgi:NAD(P) transhydrogenase